MDSPDVYIFLTRSRLIGSCFLPSKFWSFGVAVSRWIEYLQNVTTWLLCRARCALSVYKGPISQGLKLGNVKVAWHPEMKINFWDCTQTHVMGWFRGAPRGPRPPLFHWHFVLFLQNFVSKTWKVFRIAGAVKYFGPGHSFLIFLDPPLNVSWPLINSRNKSSHPCLQCPPCLF